MRKLPPWVWCTTFLEHSVARTLEILKVAALWHIDQTASISSAKWLMSDLLEWMRRTQRLLPESAYRRCVMLCTMVLFHFTSRPTNTHLSWIISYSACDCETGWFVYWMELWEVSRPRLICDRLIKSLKHNQVMDISASDHLRVLPVTISSDLSVDKHVANVCSSGFYWLCQFRRVRRSLDPDSIKTIVHAFMMSRVDYCNPVFAGSSRYIIYKLQCVLNAAARLVTGTHISSTTACRTCCMRNCTGSTS